MGIILTLSMLIMIESQTNEDHMTQFNRFLPILTSLRNVTECIRYRFGPILLLTIPFLYVSLVVNVYFTILSLKPTDHRMPNSWWSCFIVLENMLRISIICVGIENIHNQVSTIVVDATTNLVLENCYWK